MVASATCPTFWMSVERTMQVLYYHLALKAMTNRSVNEAPAVEDGHLRVIQIGIALQRQHRVALLADG